ncbi:hypothetical protein [Desulforamulus aeronauticus]|uniref:Uncharacterized protein n=1 Tax=Desulforamulus aeronauticus DSM 10349 TaxID=1121421 RepID=A0A1M6VSU3_9FIRM|nr:hypothetical protein [Desulforamulus aeronauticus]SHK84538.1 hypothetical protein SAMN02745123_03333 [Desulforamulus aeronauticus DSM 10349]
MVLAIVCIAFALIILGLWPAWKLNSKRENVFTVICIGVSFTVLLLRSLEVTLPDPTRLLVEWLRSVGIDR